MNCTLGAQKKRPLNNEFNEPRAPPAGGKNRVWLYDCEELSTRCKNSSERNAMIRFWGVERYYSVSNLGLTGNWRDILLGPVQHLDLPASDLHWRTSLLVERHYDSMRTYVVVSSWLG